MEVSLDLSKVQFVVKEPPKPKTDFETKQEVIKDGVVQWQVPLLMVNGAGSLDIRVTVAGDPGLEQLDKVVPVGLECHMLTKGNQTMVWWTVESVSPASSSARPAARKAAGE